MWVYWFKVYKDQKNAMKQLKSLEEDWWIYYYNAPTEVKSFKTRKGNFGIKFIMEA